MVSLIFTPDDEESRLSTNVALKLFTLFDGGGLYEAYSKPTICRCSNDYCIAIGFYNSYHLRCLSICTLV